MVRLIVIRGLDFPVPHYARFLQSFLGPRTSLDTRSEPGQIWCSNDVTPKVCDPPGEPVLGVALVWANPSEVIGLMSASIGTFMMFIFPAYVAQELGHIWIAICRRFLSDSKSIR